MGRSDILYGGGECIDSVLSILGRWFMLRRGMGWRNMDNIDKVDKKHPSPILPLYNINIEHKYRLPYPYIEIYFIYSYNNIYIIYNLTYYIDIVILI